MIDLALEIIVELVLLEARGSATSLGDIAAHCRLKCGVGAHEWGQTRCFILHASQSFAKGQHLVYIVAMVNIKLFNKSRLAV